MAGEISVATKQQAQEIKQDTEELLNRPIPSSGTDWSQYTPFSENINIPNPYNHGSWDSLINIQGEGYLSKFIVRQSTSSTYGGYRIVLDGEVIYYLSAVTGNTTRIRGVLTDAKILSIGSSNTLGSILNTGSIVAFESTEIFAGVIGTSQRTNLSTVLSNPLFFEESLVIEYQSNLTVLHEFRIEGGVK